jgi:hypothetical protein
MIKMFRKICPSRGTVPLSNEKTLFFLTFVGSCICLENGVAGDVNI